MTRQPALAALAVAAALATAVAGTAPGSAAGATAAAPRAVSSAQKGAAGTWTKVSTGSVAIGDQPSLIRTSDRDLHLVYAAASPGVIRHSAILTDGTLDSRSVVIGSPTPWSEVVPDPVVVSKGGGGLQVLFGGIRGDGNPLYDAGRMYATTSVDAGVGWSLDATAAGHDVAAHSQDGTAATTLANGTPVAGFALDNQLIWHVGQSDAVADQSYTAGAPADFALSHATFVRSGSEVWAGWLQHGPSAATTGFFAMRILPTVGTPAKAPGSSVGTETVTWLTRTPLAVSSTGGVFEAYCVGAPSCGNVRIWQVGTSQTADVPHSRFATTIALSAGPLGRLWVAWADNLPTVRAASTDRTGLRVGAVQTAGLPPGGAALSLAMNGTVGRGDIVLNAGNGMWHTQVFPGLTLQASPVSWRHGSRQKVVFTVSDAGDRVRGAKVKVGTLTCSTGSSGTCSITFPRTFGKGGHVARATKVLSGPAALRLKVR